MGELFRTSVLFLIVFAAMALLYSDDFSTGQKPQTIKVVMDDNYPPYIFRDSSGELKGILIDQWKLWEIKTGIKAEIHAMDWGKALESMQQGGYDVIDTIFFSEERAKLYDFTKPYVKIEVPIFFNKNISGINDVRSLHGFNVGVKKGDACIAYLKKNGLDSELQLYDSYEEIIKDAAASQLHIFVVDKPPALYFLYKMNIDDEFNSTKSLYVGEFHRAVKKGEAALLNEVEKGFDAISANEKEEIEEKWKGSSPAFTGVYVRGIIIALSVLAALFLILLLWSRMLQRQVKLKTAQLRTTLEELKKSEENYRFLFENLQDIFYRTDLQGNLTMTSPSVFRLTGYTMEEALKLNTARDVYQHPEEKDKFYELLNKNGFVQNFRVQLKKKNGDVVWVSTNSHFIYDKSGNIAGVEGTIRDISDSVKTEEEVLKAQKLESIGTFAGGIAHDFNNILAGILGNVSLARYYSRPEDKVSARLCEIEKASIRAKSLTQQLLTYSKGGNPVKKMINIKNLLKDSVQFALRGTEVGHTLSIPDDLWPVEVDDGQINQVITNLVINAAESMPDGGTVRISAENITFSKFRDFIDGNYIKISVRDEGVGITPKNLEKIFDPFFTTKAKGYGLGLSTTYSIIKRHEGYITAESKLGAGSEFSFYLPAFPGRIVNDPVETPSSNFKGVGRILVMDDEEIILEVTRQFLAISGFSVTTANNGTAAIELYKKAMGEKKPYNLIIMDLTIPGGMGGKEAFDRIKQFDPSVRAIVSSGYSIDPIMSEYEKHGFMAVLVKPYNVDNLRDAIIKVLGTFTGT